MAKTVAPRGQARERVLGAALELFVERGVSGTSLQMIADHLGLSKASVYYQFQSKDEIALEVLRPVLEDIARVVRIAEVLPTPEARRDAAFSGFVEFVVRHRRVIRVIYGDPTIDRLINENQPYKEATDQIAVLLAGPQSDTLSRVSTAVLVAGIHYSAADPDLADLDDMQLRAALLECSRRVIATMTNPASSITT